LTHSLALPRLGNPPAKPLRLDAVAASPLPGRNHKDTVMDAKEFIQKTVSEHPVVLFMKGTAQFPQCGFSGKTVQVLKACGVKNMVTVNILEDDEVRQAIKDFSNWPTIPQLYIGGEFIGGADIVTEMFQSGELQKLLPADTTQ
jgi:monothiol glutaredoxin